ncbi:MAG TPA: type IV pilin N-terminal domain-containing protein, partial [Candidatus Thermoplasmatota archaeon]|nr:type IV pilin N-terminal domain-containing protein [Candidatus Thermoplasmatota archaeon]
MQKINRPPSRPGNPRLGPQTRAASEVLGSILLIGVTVLMVGGLTLALASRPGPIETHHADLSVSILQGTGDWGTGDEIIQMRHGGGETILADSSRVLYTIDGVTTRLEGAAIGSAFSDGRFQIGETWTRTVTISVGQNVEVFLVSVGQTSESVVSSNLLAASCNGDSTPPYVQGWTQAPVDVKASTTGAVTVTAIVADACSGVDQATTPNLYYRVNDGSNPAFTNGGAMTLTATSTWQKSIPDQTWANHVGKTLEYKVGPIADVRTNSGESAVNADPIQADCGSDNQAPTVQTWTQNP